MIDCPSTLPVRPQKMDSNEPTPINDQEHTENQENQVEHVEHWPKISVNSQHRPRAGRVEFPGTLGTMQGHIKKKKGRVDHGDS